MSDELLDPEQRRMLADTIAQSRRELERMVERMNLEAVESFEEVVRPAVGTLLREARAALVQAWHRANGETAWPAGMRGPVPVQNLSRLVQSTLAETLAAMDVTPRLRIGNGLVPSLIDENFPEGTALELLIDRKERTELPQAELALVLIPAERYLILLGFHMVTRERANEEWPGVCEVRSKIGPVRAERWNRDELMAFVAATVGRFHATVSGEIRQRKSLPESAMQRNDEAHPDF